MPPPPEQKQAKPAGIEEVAPLVQRAQAGDTSVLPQLRALLDSRPDLWRQAGDLGRHAREALLALAAGGDLLAGEAIRRRMDELEAELAGPSPSPLEKLLAQRCTLCWAQAHLADLDAVRSGRVATPQGAHALRRQDSAQRRYLQALKALATVRRLLKPPLSPVELALQPVAEANPDPAKVPDRLRSRAARQAVLN
jgi:hypothetical protein